MKKGMSWLLMEFIGNFALKNYEEIENFFDSEKGLDLL